MPYEAHRGREVPLTITASDLVAGEPAYLDGRRGDRAGGVSAILACCQP